MKIIKPLIKIIGFRTLFFIIFELCYFIGGFYYMRNSINSNPEDYLYKRVQLILYGIETSNLSLEDEISDDTIIEIGNMQYTFGNIKDYLKNYDLKNCLKQSKDLRKNVYYEIDMLGDSSGSKLPKTNNVGFRFSVENEYINFIVEPKTKNLALELNNIIVDPFSKEFLKKSLIISNIKVDKPPLYLVKWFEYCKN